MILILLSIYLFLVNLPQVLQSTISYLYPFMCSGVGRLRMQKIIRGDSRFGGRSCSSLAAGFACV